jgi:hypothetical protein
MTQPTNRRRWFRFSLRMLLVVVTVLCVWLGFKVNAARRQKEAIKAVLDLHGFVEYSHQYANGIWGGSRRDDKAAAPGPAWLKKWFGDEYFVSAIGLQFWGQPVTDEDLVHIGDLTNLQYLSFVGGSALPKQIKGPGLARLRNLTKLRFLDLIEHPITDDSLQFLEPLTELEHLDLRNTQVTGNGFEHFKQLRKLQSVLFNNAPVTDQGLPYLMELPSLQMVSLQNTKVTNEGVEKLHQAMPNTKIQH